MKIEIGNVSKVYSLISEDTYRYLELTILYYLSIKKISIFRKIPNILFSLTNPAVRWVFPFYNNPEIYLISCLMQISYVKQN